MRALDLVVMPKEELAEVLIEELRGLLASARGTAVTLKAKHVVNRLCAEASPTYRSAVYHVLVEELQKRGAVEVNGTRWVFAGAYRSCKNYVVLRFIRVDR